MAIKLTDSGQRLENNPNVVPMIDILLVLLIIFMMIIPMSRKALEAQLPDPTPVEAPPDANPDQIVLEVKPEGEFAINSQPVAKAELFNRVEEIFDGRPNKVIFIKGDTTVLYKDVIWAMDQVRGAGVKAIGIPPKG